MPGSARAAATSAEVCRPCESRGPVSLRRWVPAFAGTTFTSSIAPTAASADAVAAAGRFLALVDVLLRLRFQRRSIELHVGLRELALLPRLRRIERRAAG